MLKTLKANPCGWKRGALYLVLAATIFAAIFNEELSRQACPPFLSFPPLVAGGDPTAGAIILHHKDAKCYSTGKSRLAGSLSR